jgi:hypothetical protein
MLQKCAGQGHCSYNLRASPPERGWGLGADLGEAPVSPVPIPVPRKEPQQPPASRRPFMVDFTRREVWRMTGIWSGQGRWCTHLGASCRVNEEFHRNPEGTDDGISMFHILFLATIGASRINVRT